MKYKLKAFLAGRNGMDALAKAIFWPALLLIIVSGFFGNALLRMLLYLVGLAALFYTYFRIFSRNVEKRRAENNAYLSRKNFRKQRFQQRKTHHFYHCPRCKSWLRVPKGAGRVNITCKSCGERFIKNT